ncbi:hypothetical protein RHMOL_Rhmol02G0179600 [Rhododendron molle]|uniref:Uncharacterized protein n=1 Tax=Rhododendron molle TaxID=49168 RepID=A0ACC0PST6_RHOML|nr:hypothetical protein RHMOL_Rhmol02G0179600 [Rhododendron molle]
MLVRGWKMLNGGHQSEGSTNIRGRGRARDVARARVGQPQAGGAKGGKDILVEAVGFPGEFRRTIIVEVFQYACGSNHLVGEIGITLDDIEQLLGLTVSHRAVQTDGDDRDSVTLLKECLKVIEVEAMEE